MYVRISPMSEVNELCPSETFFLSERAHEHIRNQVGGGGSRISGKGVHVFKGVGVPVKMTETKIFHFHRIFKKGRQGGLGDSSKLPKPPADPPLLLSNHS